MGARASKRDAPAAADAVAFTGGLGIAVGVLLLAVDFNTHGHGRWPGVALFAVLVAVGYLALGVLPRELHAAAVTLIVAGVPGAIGWWILPHAHRFGDIRPFLVLTILAWAACWIAPRTRGRTIFVAAALLLLWLWMIGEAAGTDAYSASPIPSPPAHTMFSLSALHGFSSSALRGFSSSALHGQVTIGDLDPSSTLYPIALRCSEGDGAACDTLFDQSEPGSNFEQFADTCGNTQSAGSGDQCADLSGRSSGGTFGTNPTPFGGRIVPGTVGAGSSDKSLEIGLVSLLFGVAYVGALWVLDRRRWHGLGTALVVPGVVALFTGTEVLGNAANHAWFGGLLTFVAGVAFALVGDVGGRRFTAWAGGVLAAFGVYTFAGDVTNFKGSFTGLDVKLVRPALITIAFGAGLVALASLIASLRSRDAESGGSPRVVPPDLSPFETAFNPPAPPAPSRLPAWQPPAPPPPPWQPPAPPNPPWQPPAPPAPPSPPWQPPPVPPPSPPWQPPAPPPPPPPGSGPV